MWYEILPSALIILGALAMPTYFSYYINWLVFKGHPYRRDLGNVDQRRWYLREWDRFGSTYNFRGLDAFFEEVEAAEREEIKNRSASGKEGGSGDQCVCEDDKSEK